MVRAVGVRESGSRGGEDGEDRISQLPEEIIHAILNRLKSPEAAAGTSVLSRRWLQLWRRYPFFVSPLSKSNAKFRSFVASSSRKLLASSSSTPAIQDFRISVQDDGFEKEDLDRLLSLIADHADGLLLSLSPVKFVLRVDQLRTRPSYSLLRVPNWSRTKSITLGGCDLRNRDDNRSNNRLASLPNLESLRLEVVDLSERLLRCFLDNAPRLVKLKLWGVYGIDRLEVVSSPRLRSLRLSYIYRSKNRSQRMRSLRISSPKLETLWTPSGLEELGIDAPDLVSLSWTVLPDDPVTKVNLVNLTSTCRSEIRVCSPSINFSPRWLTASFSAAVSQFHRLDLVLGFPIYLARREQEWFDLSQADQYGSAPRAIDQVKFEAMWSYIPNNDVVARFLELFFSICRPESMSINVCYCAHRVIVQYICHEYMMIGSFYGVTISASWKHHLKDMKIKDEITGDMIDISKDGISSLANRQSVRCMFTWC